ncbi:MAG: alkaline phosphatase [Verrucomicrobiaceae bacterium]|nr:MAG: alkaline phosphatase [Verrucomicrobiaceae bacterium]
MNERFDNGTEIGRRDWLKAATLTGAATALAGAQASAEPTGKPAGKVRGVIFMVSDGMSPGVLTLAEAYSKMTRKHGTQWWSLMNDRKACRGLMDTASANSLVTDSAAASSAWGGGQRVNNGSINFTPEGKEVPSIASILKKKGIRIGLVSTATITHATPAGFASSVSKRGEEDDIAPQYLERVDVILGGGSGHFSGKDRKDKRDLAGDFAKAGYGVVRNREGLLAAKEEKLLGTFTRGHLPFTIDRDQNPAMAAAVPTLTEMAKAALTRLLSGDKPFLLQIEGARIDHAAHLNDIGALLNDQLAFDDALAAVLVLIAKRDDIQLVVTSDHGNANPGLNGIGGSYNESTRCFGRVANMKASHERLFAEWGKVKDGNAESLTKLIKQHLDFTLKPAESEALIEIFQKHPVIEWNEQLSKPEGLLGQFAGNRTGIGWTGTTHTSDPTLVSALGPQSDRFSGMVRNSDVFGHLMEMLG